jgi:hypothetical protein
MFGRRSRAKDTKAHKEGSINSTAAFGIPGAAVLLWQGQRAALSGRIPQLRDGVPTDSLRATKSLPEEIFAGAWYE